MFQKFFTDTLQSKYIKAILNTTPLPVYPSVRDGDYLIKDLIYVYKSSLIKCTRTGYIYTNYTKFITADNHKIGPDLRTTGLDMADYDIISSYVYGENYPQYTQTYVSNYRYYDPDTHVNLGKLLRIMRDSLDIDLMPFYNCYATRVINNLTLNTSEESKGYSAVKDSKYRLYAVPIKFNQEYTIALSSNSEVLIKSVVYGKYNLIQQRGAAPYTDYLKESHVDAKGQVQRKHSSLKYLSTQFNKPIYYSISNKEQDARERLYEKYPDTKTEFSQEQIDTELRNVQALENNLYLVIQTDTDIQTSLTVLEGHYRYYGDFKTRHLTYSEYEDPEDFLSKLQDLAQGNNPYKLTPKYINEQLISNLSLLHIDTKELHAFSARLFEYLTLGVIDPQDDIAQNIIRVQKYTGYMYSLGFFDPLLRAEIFYSYLGYKVKSTSRFPFLISPMAVPQNDLDITGYVDKNVEKFITRGLEV